MLLISLITAVQVILIIKIWMMTGDVRKIRQKLNEPQAENRKITEAQLKALEGKTEEAYTLYKEAYYYSVVTFFNELENKNLKDTEAKEKAWEEGFRTDKPTWQLQTARRGIVHLCSDKCTNRETINYTNL